MRLYGIELHFFFDGIYSKSKSGEVVRLSKEQIKFSAEYSDFLRKNWQEKYILPPLIAHTALSCLIKCRAKIFVTTHSADKEMAEYCFKNGYCGGKI